MDSFERCLENRRLVVCEPDPARIAGELKTARAEWRRAESCHEEGRFEECVVQGYFAMVRTFRALLRSVGYRDANLYGLCVGVERFFVESDRIDPRFLILLREAKDKKDAVQSGGRMPRRDVIEVLRGAEEVVLLGHALLALSAARALPDSHPSSEDLV